MQNLNAARIWLYALPSFPLAALGLPLYIYLPTFYAEAQGLSLALIGAVLLLARSVDVISDPLMGYWADTLRWRYRRKALMLIATPWLMLSIWALFNPPAQAGMLWLAGWSVSVYLAWSLLTLPYHAWGAELATDYDRRNHITAWREAFVLGGTLAAAALPFALGFGSDETAAILGLLSLAFLILLPSSLLFSLRLTPEPARHASPVHWLAGLKLLQQNTLFKRLLLAYLLNGLANGLPATLFLLYVTHVLQSPDAFGLLLGVYFISGLLCLPLGLWLAKRMDKHRVWTLSMLWAALVFSGAIFLGPGDVAWFLLICLLSGMSLGIDMALPASIQADVIDVDTHQGGGQRSGLFFGLWGMTTKLALAFAVGLSFPLLELSGFDAQTDSPPVWALALLYGVLPLPFKLAAAALMWRFPLGRAQHAQLQQHILHLGAHTHETTPSQPTTAPTHS